MTRILAIACVIFGCMLGEAWLSVRNEARLRALGAIEPPDDVFQAMRIAYPGAFLLMTAEGLLRTSSGTNGLLVGTALFALGKLLKYVAMATLGDRWSFRVLVLPGAPLVSSGIYAHIRHPNYVALIGEFAGAALLLHAPVAGFTCTLGFAALVKKRIQVEQRALMGRTHTQSSKQPTTPPGRTS
jgi:methyltransferase